LKSYLNMGNNICACKRQTEFKDKMENYRIIYSWDLDYDINSKSNFENNISEKKPIITKTYF